MGKDARRAGHLHPGPLTASGPLHRNGFGVSPVSTSRTTPPGLPATQDTVNATGRRTSKQVIHGITSLAAAPAAGLPATTQS